jgi:hypothetical protein
MRKTVKLIIDGLSCPGHSYKYVFGLTDLEESDSYIMEQRELFIRKKIYSKFEGGYSSDDENMRIIIKKRAIMIMFYQKWFIMFHFQVVFNILIINVLQHI